MKLPNKMTKHLAEVYFLRMFPIYQCKNKHVSHVILIGNLFEIPYNYHPMTGDVKLINQYSQFDAFI